ncbi:MAG: transporter substrate-binding domain-containing protein [Verrucomicrobiota bacterium]
MNASVISGGWATWTPYQYQERLPTGGRQLTGLDIEVMNAAAELAGLNPIYQEIVWDRHLRSIEAGNLDFAMGATRQAAREEYAWFSRPYRHEAIFVFCRKGEGALWEGDSPIDTLKAIRDRGGKISLEAGSFFGQEVSDLIAEPAEASWVDTHPTTAQVLQALLHGEVDAVLMDRFAGLSAAWNQDVLDELEELSGPVHVSPISMMFSKATVSPETVASFDAAIAELEQSGRLRYFARHTLIPSLLVITLGSTWFFYFGNGRYGGLCDLRCSDCAKGKLRYHWRRSTRLPSRLGRWDYARCGQ